MKSFICAACGKTHHSAVEAKFRANQTCPYCGAHQRGFKKIRRNSLHIFNAILALSFVLTTLYCTYLISSRNEQEKAVWQEKQAEVATYAPIPSARVMMAAVTPTPAPTPTPTLYAPDPAAAVMIAKLTFGESRGVESITEQAAVMWCVLSRSDSEGYGMGVSIEYVVTFPHQFQGYAESNPVIDDFGRDLVELAEDVLTRWMREKDGQANVGRVLPNDYLWFEGDGETNYFRNAYRGGTIWDWSLPSPYES